MDKNLYNFSVQVYGDLTEYSPTISTGRCRIFYKGVNRNGSFINDQFAEKLLNTLPYTPVKGIYSAGEGDYTTHGTENSQGRIYGVVPENPNVTWESHMDEDGVTREYACCDVYIFSALYEEAGEILQKPESMELYPPSIQGQWTYIEGQKVFEFTDGCFFGLQVLGDEVEPCFEGAAFFTLNDKMEQAFAKLAKLKSTFELNETGGKVEMQTMNFKLSEGNEIYQELFALLNPAFAESGEVKYGICEVTDEYALVRNYELGTYEKINYTIAEFKKEDDEEEKKPEDEDKEETEGEDGADPEKKDEEEDKSKSSCHKKYELAEEASTCYMITVSETEKASLESVQQMNGGTFEKIEEVFARVPELESKVTEIETKNSDFEQKIAEKDNEFFTLKSERDEFADKFANANADLEAAKASLDELVSYKFTVETANKQALLDKYASKLDAETIAKYPADSDISIDALEKELAYELVKSDASLFSSEDKAEAYVPVEQPLTGIEAILNKYKK